MKTTPDQKYPLDEDPGQFGLGRKLPAFPGSEMTQARTGAAERALAMPNPEPQLPSLGQEPVAPMTDAGTPAPTPQKTQVFTAEGDPYEYVLGPDASVTIKSGPTGTGTKLTTGAAYQAIMGQIASGQLKPAEAVEPPLHGGESTSSLPGMPEDQRRTLGWSTTAKPGEEG